jgi:transcriptional regulator with XRE-family HTH domain
VVGVRFSPNGRRTAKASPKTGRQKLLAPAELGQRVRQAREEGHISRLSLGYALACAPTLIQKWEEGLCWPKIPDLLLLTRFLNKPMDYFLHGLDGPTFEELALDMGIITEAQLLQVRSESERRWRGNVPFDYPDDPERDGITEEVRDRRRERFGEIHLTNRPRRRPSREGEVS